MKQLSDYILVTDLDGTLIDSNHKIIPRNEEAIKRFIAAGGKFAIATGRPLEWTRTIAEQLQVNFPCVIHNGGAVYDFTQEKYLYEAFLPEGITNDLKLIAKKYPNLYVSFSGRTASENDIYILEDYLENPKEYLPEGLTSICKLLFFIEQPEIHDEFFSFVNNLENNTIRFVGSGYGLVELLPKEITKASALAFIAESFCIKREQFVTVGDYYNDLEMITYAGIGATLSTSPKELKNVADIVVGELSLGAVADVIEYLEAKIQ